MHTYYILLILSLMGDGKIEVYNGQAGMFFGKGGILLLYYSLQAVQYEPSINRFPSCFRDQRHISLFGGK